MSGEGDLRERLQGLLGEASSPAQREALRPLLESFLAAPREARERPEGSGRFGLIGASAAMQTVYEWIERAAPTELPVLIEGETGTGKEIVARALHEGSARSAGPFLAENCAAVAPGLLESELFGHVKGSFTGAVADRDGHFVAARSGTLFLDEVGDMPLEMQAKLLRVIEMGEVRPVGSSRVVPVDVRLVAATNHDFDELVRAKLFRQDLAYRLNVVRIALPPLRERREDIEPLAQHFLEAASAKSGRGEAQLSSEALALLEAAAWPGNVRQLQNEIQRAVALSGAIIGPRDLSPSVSEGT